MCVISACWNVMFLFLMSAAMGIAMVWGFVLPAATSWSSVLSWCWSEMSMSVIFQGVVFLSILSSLSATRSPP